MTDETNENFLFMTKRMRKLNGQKLKTRVIYNDVNPEWNEDLTLSVTDPNLKVLLVSSVHKITLV